MKSCSSCGASNLDSESACGVCGGVLNESGSTTRRFFAEVPAGSGLHLRGLVTLLASVAVTVAGMFLLVSNTDFAVIGFYMLFIGLAAVGSVIGMFRGLPYQPNLGWHRSGDPDIAATNTKGSVPSNYKMMEVDREIEAKQKDEEND
jgi:hypothetical protein